MWQVTVFCSDCSEETQLVVADLDEIQRQVCACGYSFVLLSVAGFEPEYAQDGELVVLAPRASAPLAA